MLENGEDILKLLSDAISEGIVVVDEHQNIVSTNASANAMFGYEDNELVGKTLNTLIPVEYHQRHVEHFHSFFKHSEKRSMGQGRNLYGLTKSHMRFPVEVGLNPFTLYGKTLVMALVVDITERRAIEENQPVRLRPFSAAIASACLAQAEDGRGVEKVRAQLEELFTKNKEAVDYIVNHAESMRGRLRGRGPLQETEGKPANAENARGFARGSSRGCRRPFRPAAARVQQAFTGEVPRR